MNQEDQADRSGRRSTGGLTRWLGLYRSPYDRQILRLALPALGALAAEPLFLLADSAIVGRLGTPQLAGLGIASMVLSTLVGLFVFLAYATTGSVARALGAGNRPAAISYGIDGLWLALGLGLAIGVVGWLATPAIVAGFGPSEAAAGHAVLYLRISLVGIPAMFLTFAGTGLLRGLQDTRTPLAVATVMYLSNIVLNLALVYGFGMGIAGAALGSVLAQVGGAAAYLTMVARWARRHQVSLRPDRAGVRAAARAGGPLLIRTVTLRVALLVTTFVATSFGDVALAAHQVAFTIWSGLSLCLDAIAIAGQAIIGRALGAADVGRTRAVTRRMNQWGVLAGLVTGLLLIAARPLYVPLFSTDPAVRDALSSAVGVVALFLPAAGVVFSLDGVLIGAGDGRYLAKAGIIALACYLPLTAWVLLTDSGLVALWFAFGGYIMARLGTLVWRERQDGWLVTGQPPAR